MNDAVRAMAAKLAKVRKENRQRHLNEKILVVDGLNTFLRCFTVNPATNDNGEHIGGISGFIKALAYSIRLYDPTRVVIVFDGAGGSAHRRSIYEGYKANRVNTTTLNRYDGFSSKEEEKEAIQREVYRLGLYLKELPVTILSIDDIEADDVIAFIATDFEEAKEIVLYSTDKDYIQLVNQNISHYRPNKKKLYTPKEVIEEFGVHPANFHIYKCFINDDSDNIKGVKGIGPKTLLKMYPELAEETPVSFDLIKERAEMNPDANNFKKVLDNWDKIELNEKLVNLSLVDFSNMKKMRIFEILREPIKVMDQDNLRQLVMEDRLFSDVPDINSLLVSSFKRLEGYKLE